VAGHDPGDYARVIGDLLDRPERRAQLRRGAVAHAARFGWSATAAGVLDVYCAALDEQETPRRLAVNSR
jgi:D-inositol-3-phosphate glycosyltransferase